jgi:hypothetical protein
MGSLRLLAIAIVLIVPAVAVVPLNLTGDADTAYADPFESVPPLPEGSDIAGVEGVTISAIELADALGTVRIPDPDGGPGEPCPTSRLTVSWEQPGIEYFQGAYVHPLGPEPTRATTEVNGVVLCDDAPGYFMGFTAMWTDFGWAVFDVPDPDEHGSDSPLADALDPSELLDLSPFELRNLPVLDVDLTARWTGRWGPEIEGFAPYEPQQLCDPWPKPGLLAFTRLVLRAYPDTASWGIARDCAIGGTSEHKEGRAWDWRVDVFTPADAEAADQVISWLLATDEYGNTHAMARRLGVMYIIWNRMIWSSTRADDGWRPYFGVSPHTDHVHLSLSRAGAMGRTSFWEGVAFDTLPSAGNPFEGIPSALPARVALPPIIRAQAEQQREEARERREEWEARRAEAAAASAERDDASSEQSGEPGTGGSSGSGGGTSDPGDTSGPTEPAPAPGPGPGPVEQITEQLPALPSEPAPVPGPALPPPPDAGEALDPVVEEIQDVLADIEDALNGPLGSQLP